MDTVKTLCLIGTSAGGRQPKIIVAIDSLSGRLFPGYLYSNLISPNHGLDYLLLKFDSPHIPLAEIEYLYHLTAIRGGIDMAQCFLWKSDGVNYFLTRRFDRKGGKKILAQTMAAINPEASSYEDVVAT